MMNMKMSRTVGFASIIMMYVPNRSELFNSEAFSIIAPVDLELAF